MQLPNKRWWTRNLAEIYITEICGFLSFLATASPRKAQPDRSFVIDYAGNQFLRDGKPFQMIGAAVHYYTIPEDYWMDRLIKVRAMGVNVVQVYVPWNLHEPRQGEYHFTGMADIDRFLMITNSLGLLVSMRPTPFIDSEWDMGGLPAWLLKYDSIKLRSSDPPLFIMAVKRWYDVLLPRLRRHLYQNGGPIISAQVENEYGAFACDKVYLAFIRDMLLRHLGPNIILFTTDSWRRESLECGTIPLTYATIDFGPTSFKNVSIFFANQKQVAPKGPLVNSEFYTGWFDQWGDDHQTSAASKVVETMEYMWSFNASFTFYMGVGGTLWGYWAAGEGEEPGEFRSVTTSYDYDAPISEAGDLTPKFFAIRAAVERHFRRRLPWPVPQAASPKAKYGQIRMVHLGTILDLLPILSPEELVVQTRLPVNVEQLEWNYGFVLYESIAPNASEHIILSVVNDRAYILVAGNLVAILQRPAENFTVEVSIAQGDAIQILVENQGRIGYGQFVYDRKGLMGDVTLDEDVVVTDWQTYPIDISLLWRALNDPRKYSQLTEKAQRRKFKRSDKIARSAHFIPSFYVAKMQLPMLRDTFLNPTGWSKGQAFVNGINLGRYWPLMGPQITLYVPKPYLKQTTRLLLFELDDPGNCLDNDRRVCSIEFTDKPIFRNDNSTAGSPPTTVSPLLDSGLAY